jgi:lysozyme family protein
VQHPYEVLKGEYQALIASAKIRPECEHVLHVTCDRLLRDKAVYQRIFERTGVPVAALMALSEREMSGNLHCYFGNGQKLTMRTTIVPKGRGPFPDTLDGFIAGALDALHLDGLDQVARTPEGWTLPRFGFESELWNGFGYRAHGIPTPYFVGGTTAQKPGKFVADHEYSATLMDPQLGTLAIVEELFKLDPSLVFGGAIAKLDDAPSIVPQPLPTGLGGGFMIDVNDEDSVKALEIRLNQVKATAVPIAVNGSYDRETMAAVRAYQVAHGLTVDGLAGPETLDALDMVRI